jgi:hypothetical protein
MLVEVDDSHLNYLEGLRKLVDQIGSSQDRTALLKMFKKVAPNTPIPELDAAEPLERRDS